MENNEVKSYLAFSINGEVFAVDVQSVLEVKDAQKLTKLPIKVKMVLGLMAYSDQFVPVIDSRAKFDFPARSEMQREVYVVAEVQTQKDGCIKLAFTADKVLGVIQIENNKISDMPDMGVNKVEYIVGISKLNDQSIILLDINKVFSVDEILLIEKAKLEIA